MDTLVRIIKKYGLLVFALYATGSIFIVSFNYNTAIPILFATSTLFYLSSIMKHGTNILKNQVLVFNLLLIFIMLVLVINNTSKFTSYIAILMQILISYMICQHIVMEEFISRYTNAICFFAATSLVCYFVMLIYPGVMLYFPLTIGESSVNYYNAFIHVFESTKGYSTFAPFKRNAGIFWEPGAYQAFLNLGLVFLLNSKHMGSGKHDILKVVILVSAVITTYSTTGYIILVLIIISNYAKLKSMLSHISVIVLLGIFALVFVVYFTNKNGIGGNFMSGKLNTEFGSNGSFINRLFLDDLNIVFEKPQNILGISYETYRDRRLSSGNSIVQTLVTLGAPFTIILLCMYYKFCSKFNNKFLFFIILIMIFSTESLIWRPIFLCLAWYGLCPDKSLTAKQINSNNKLIAKSYLNN